MLPRLVPVRLGLVAAGLLLVASLTACSDDAGSGSSASGGSKDDFCGAFNSLFEGVVSSSPEADSSDLIRALHEWAVEIEDVGPPGEMPDDARRGFELFVDEAQRIDEDADLAELQDLGKDLSEADQRAAEEFTDWTQENCPFDLPSGS